MRCAQARGLRTSRRFRPRAGVLVADTRGYELLVFGQRTRLSLRQRRPRCATPRTGCRLVGSWPGVADGNQHRRGYDPRHRHSSKRWRYRTVQQPQLPGLFDQHWHPYVGLVLGSVCAGARGAGVRHRDSQFTADAIPKAGTFDLSDEYELLPLRLPPDLTRITAHPPGLDRGPSNADGAHPSFGSAVQTDGSRRYSAS